MKRIIFSVWNDVTEEHQSVSDKKKKAFSEYKDRLISCQKAYAHRCGAEYVLCTPESRNYDDIQFFKLLQFEKLSEEYDEVVYFDLDVIPTTQLNIFEKHASHIGVGVHFIENKPMWNYRENGEWWVNAFQLDKMNMIVKTCMKNAMLTLEDITGNNDIANTGVLIGNKNSIQDFRLSERLLYADKVFDEAKEDNIYPEEINQYFEKNNEVYFSFIKERFDIKINRIGLGWHYIVDNVYSFKTVGAHITHVVNKDFKRYSHFLDQTQTYKQTLL
jgi:hypothetical protein